MSFQDQRTDDHPEAVRSDPVPVPPSDHDARPADDSDYDASTQDAVVEDRGTFDDPAVGDTNHDGGPDRTGVEDDVTERDMAGEPVARDDVDRDLDEEGTVDEREGSETGIENASWTDGPNDRDADGVDDRVEDAALDDRGTFDDPVVASPVDVDENRADEGTIDGESPVFGEPAVAPTALGATALGGPAAAAAVVGGDDREDRVADETAPVGTTDTVRAETTDMRPGDVPTTPVVALVSTDVAHGFRERWREVQLRFVDDPRAAAGEAQNLAEEAVEALISALSAHKSDLGGWEATEGGDTEQLRVVVRRYRDFLERVLAS
jgi:hypothetical protein